MKKILLWIAAGIVGVILLAYIGLLLFFPTDRVRQYIEDEGTKRLGRPVMVGDLSVSLWSGIGVTLEKITVGDLAEPPQLARIEAIDIKVQFWPLFSGEYIVDRIIVQRPEIAMSYSPTGETNFSLPPALPGDTTDPRNQIPGGEDIDDETAVLLGGLTLGDVRVTDGSLVRTDHVAGREMRLWGISFIGSLLTEGEKLNSAGNFAFDSARYIEFTPVKESPETAGQKIIGSTGIPATFINYEVQYNALTQVITVDTSQITILGATIIANGEIKNFFTVPNADMQYRVRDAQLGVIAEKLSEARPSLAERLTGLQGAINVAGSAQYIEGEEPKYSGAGEVFEFQYKVGSGVPDVGIERLQFGFTQDSIGIVTEKITAGDANAALALDVINFEDPFVGARVEGSLPLSLLTPFLPPAGDPKLNGIADVNLLARGPLNRPEQMKISGFTKLKNGSLYATTLPEPIEKFTWDVTIQPNVIQIKDLSLQFTSSRATLTGQISTPFPYLLPVADSIKQRAAGPYLDFALTSQRFDVDKLFPEAAPGTGVNRSSLPPDSLPPLPIPVLNGAGTAKFDTLIYSGIEFTNITTHVRIEKNTIHCDNIEGRMYSGKLAGNTVIDLSTMESPKYYGSFNAKSIEVDDFISRFSPWGGGGHLFGKVDMTGSYSSAGWVKQDFINKLTMDLDCKGSGLQLQSLPNIDSLMGSMYSAVGRSYSGNLQTVPLKSFQSFVKFEDGKIKVNDLKGVSEKIGTWNLGGTITLDGQLKLDGNIEPTDAQLKELAGGNGMYAQAIELIKDPKTGKVTIPLIGSGTIENPKFNVDITALQAQLNKALKQQGSDLIKGLFKK